MGPASGEAALPEADPDSLDAKYEQIQQADYFGILGLPRTASAGDVREARERLAKQYDPLRWSGHSDPSMLRRAQVVLASIEEAARTLQDDRLRAEYARHLN
jgi:DnaJ-class molecular chaperone